MRVRRRLLGGPRIFGVITRKFESYLTVTYRNVTGTSNPKYNIAWNWCKANPDPAGSVSQNPESGSGRKNGSGTSLLAISSVVMALGSFSECPVPRLLRKKVNEISFNTGIPFSAYSCPEMSSL